MPTREKSRPRPRGSDEEFVVFLQGIPAHCRWQELKDLIRQTAVHIRQAVVYDDSHGFPTGLGQIIIKNEEEAWRTYHRLSANGWEGQSIVITLSRTCAPTRPIAGPTRGPACVFPSGYMSGYSTPPRVTHNLAAPGSPESLYQSPEYAPIIGLPQPPPPFVPMLQDPLSPPTAPGPGPGPAVTCDPSLYTFTIPPPTYQFQHIPEPVVHLPAKPLFNIPSHTTNTFYTKSTRRTILIQNLSANTTQANLVTLFQEAGPIERCQFDTTATTPAYTHHKQSARITFTTPDSAKRAATLFNNTAFMGSKRIRVRIDRNPNPNPNPNPSPNPNPNPSPVPIPNHNHTTTVDTKATSAASTNSTTPASSPSPSPGPYSYRGHSSVGTSPAHSVAGGSRPASKDGPVPRQSVDKCQPLVVNGSGVGRNAVGVVG